MFPEQVSPSCLGVFAHTIPLSCNISHTLQEPFPMTWYSSFKLYFQPTMPNFVIYLPYLLTSFFLNKYSANISYRTLCWVNFIGMDQLISLYISSLQCSTCSACAGKGFVTLARGNQLIALYYYFLVAACIGLMCYLSSQTWEWTQAAAMTVSSPNH